MRRIRIALPLMLAALLAGQAVTAVLAGGVPFPIADLSVTKSDSPDPVSPGSNITYSITVQNFGPDSANSVSLTDVMSAGTSFVSFTAPAAWTTTTPAVGGTGTVTATNPTLTVATGAQAFTLVVMVGPSTPDGTIITNSASVDAIEPDSDPLNNDAGTLTTVNRTSDVSVTKSDSPDPVVPGGNLTYTITVRNLGPDGATNVRLTDVVPIGTSFVSLTAPAGWTTTTPAVGGTGTVTSDNPFLTTADGAQVFTLVVQVSGATPSGATVTNTASVLVQSPLDPASANNSDTEVTAVAAAPTAPPSPTPTPTPTPTASLLPETATH